MTAAPLAPPRLEGMDVALRDVRPGDERFLFEVYASTREDELTVLPWTAEQKRAFLLQQFSAQDRHYRQHYPGAVFRVIEVDGRCAGRLYTDRRDDEIRVIDIALLPEHRGRGLGGALMREVLREAESAGLAVRIHVERYTRALGLYERLRFRPVEDRGVYLLMEWRARDRAPAEEGGSGGA